MENFKRKCRNNTLRYPGPYRVICGYYLNPDIGGYCSYGITDGTQKIEDISNCFEKVAFLASEMNRNSLDPVHFLDVVEDYCNAGYVL